MKRYLDFLALFLIYLLVAILLKLTWLKWFDIQVDFGRELYIPWQITKGKVLYKDIAFHNGPLSNYLNAFIFKVFGVGLINIIWFNIFSMLLFIFFLYLFLRKYVDVYTTFFILIYIVCFHFFQFFVLIGNYNFIAPYSHEILHGFYLTFILFIIVSREERFSLLFFIKAGFLLGLIFLTKIEIVIVNVISFLLFIFCVFKYRFDKDIKVLLKLLAFFLASLSIVLVTGLLFKFQGLDFKDFFDSIFRAYKVAPEMNKNTFYLSRMGLANFSENIFYSIKSMLKVLFYFLLLILSAILIKIRFLKKNHLLKYFWSLIIITAIFYFIISKIKFEWIDTLGSFYNFIALLSFLVGLVLIKKKGFYNQYSTFFYFTTLASLFLIRMFFRPTIYHYGFLTALPASILFIIVVIKLGDYVGNFFNVKKYISSFIFVSFITFILTFTIKFTLPAYNTKSTYLDRGKDSFYVYDINHEFGERDTVILEFLSYADQNMKNGETFISFPDGIMLNYLLRKENPSKFYYFVPTDFILWGEENILLSIKDNLPDYILINNHPMNEFGKKGLGIDYGIILRDFLEVRYNPLVQFGNGWFHIILAKKVF